MIMSNLPDNLIYEIAPPPAIHQRPRPRSIEFTLTRPSNNRRGHVGTVSTTKSSFRSQIKAYPSHFLVLGFLLLALMLDIGGLALYMILVPQSTQGRYMVFSVLFVIIMISLAGYILRQSIILYNLLHPIPIGRDSDRSRSNLPTWLTGLPTYRDVLRHDGQPTHTRDNEGWSGMLPSYGDARGDELLMKSSISHSRGSGGFEVDVVGDRRMNEGQISVERTEVGRRQPQPVSVERTV